MAKGKASNIADKIKWLLAMGIFSVAVIGNGYYTEFAFLYRVLAVVALFLVALFILANTVFGKGAVKLMRESRTEMRRVVWPSRVETTQTFMVVFGSIVVLCLFFWALESLLSWLTKIILG
ncbi:preprotein translocase subunit SecE [Gammaproteobacteria bacterium]|jgi:preprotein translocase subunit SecE|nr:preprotein translocase subunit SecE [Gammaproteobacteria bacterium]